MRRLIHPYHRSDFPPGKPSKLLFLTLIAALTTGCIVSDDTPSLQDPGGTTESPGETPSEIPNTGTEARSIATSSTTSTSIGEDLQIDIYALERLESNILRLRFGVTNKSQQDFILNYGLTVDQKPNTPSRVSLIDAENQKRLLSYEKNDGSCFCSNWSGPIGSGETESMWVAFPVPESDDVDKLTVTTPLSPPFIDIPITENSESVDITGLSEPKILDLTFISDNTEDQTGRTESGDEVSILLSSDVLFETDSSELNSDAQEILEQVALEIDDATSEVVAVDGHADNTGNDSRNQPLSLERAQAVESVLSDLVTRGGVAFDVQGHGSTEPIADNSTEEGRERNRRVSVTFEK
ncbi:OmpA family protein [Nocardiopsis sp. YSL2]|uniref:OmpA family protein n=1 Tax=Nocardiopsis sp. YSL2 TaxID=2939492 RepID=UPI0026F42C0C|nr:OmpA family protein [Nocardiopsis sp. YSL2]